MCVFLTCRCSRASPNNVANDLLHMPIILYNNFWLHVQDASYTRGRLMGLAKARRRLPDVIIFGEYRVMWRPVKADFHNYQYSKLLLFKQNTCCPNPEVSISHPKLQRSSSVWLITRLSKAARLALCLHPHLKLHAPSDSSVNFAHGRWKSKSKTQMSNGPCAHPQNLSHPVSLLQGMLSAHYPTLPSQTGRRVEEQNALSLRPLPFTHDTSAKIGLLLDPPASSWMRLSTSFFGCPPPDYDDTPERAYHGEDPV